METSKVKRFIFAPKNESLKAALESQSNNVRKSVYLSPYSEEEFMRIRVRNHSNTTQGICRALAHRVSPITYYSFMLTVTVTNCVLPLSEPFALRTNPTTKWFKR